MGKGGEWKQRGKGGGKGGREGSLLDATLLQDQARQGQAGWSSVSLVWVLCVAAGVKRQATSDSAAAAAATAASHYRAGSSAVYSHLIMLTTLVFKSL